LLEHTDILRKISARDRAHVSAIIAAVLVGNSSTDPTVGIATRYLQPAFERKHRAKVAFDNDIFHDDATGTASIARQKLKALEELRAAERDVVVKCDLFGVECGRILFDGVRNIEVRLLLHAFFFLSF
jgi:hypothetical protein